MNNPAEEKKWEVLKTEYLLRIPYCTIRKDTCKTLRGHVADYYVWESRDIAEIVALTPDNKVVMQRQYRHPHQEWLWQLPAGTFEKNETAEEMIQRELAEETGYSVKKLILLDQCYPSLAHMPQKQYFFLGLEARETAKTNLDDAEDLTVHLVDFQEALAWLSHGKIYSLSMKYALTLAKKYLDPAP
jgi:8-oxo-dGTP pyrophosphatase MutT (NUDIX family)